MVTDVILDTNHTNPNTILHHGNERYSNNMELDFFFFEFS